MKFRILTAFVFIGVIVFTSCDKIDPIIPLNATYDEDKYGPAPTFENATPDMIFQRVLLEEFTGHKCGFCPAATIIAEGIKEENDETVSMIAIHSGDLAETDEEHYTVDWTCEESDFYFSQLIEQSNPLGRVNRAPNQEDILPSSLWSSYVDNALDEEPQAVIQLRTDYVAEDNVLNIHVFSEFLENVDENVQLTVLITESHLIGDQKDYSQDPELIEDYEFNHLLRGSVTGAQGVPLVQAPTAGTTVQKDYSYQFNSDWIPENCQVVAILSHQTGGKVINSAESYITP